MKKWVLFPRLENSSFGTQLPPKYSNKYSKFSEKEAIEKARQAQERKEREEVEAQKALQQQQLDKKMYTKLL